MPLEETFRILRFTIETQATMPSVIAVSAALPRDGTTYVACGLARAFSEAGYRTLLVDGNPTNSGISEELKAYEASPEMRVGVVSLSNESGNASEGRAKRISDLFKGLRGDFSVTIVDTPPILESALALEIAQAADQMLLAVRLGRRVHQADRDVQTMVLESRVRVMGIVPTHAQNRRRIPRNAALPSERGFEAIPIPVP